MDRQFLDALAVVKLRSMLRRAWAQWRPIHGGTVLGYTSLKQQYVYKLSAKLYKAFVPDPGTDRRTPAAWLRLVTPMAEERTVNKRGAPSTPPSGASSASPISSEKHGKKSRTGSAQPRRLQLDPSFARNPSSSAPAT